MSNLLKTRLYKQVQSITNVSLCVPVIALDIFAVDNVFVASKRDFGEILSLDTSANTSYTTQAFF